MNNIDSFIQDLLHIDAVGANKLLDLEAGRESSFYLSSYDPERNSEIVLRIIADHIGKVGNTVLRGSAESADEQIIGMDKNVLDWCSSNGERDPKELDRYIRAIYKELDLKGNNPLFLSVGTVSWKLTSTGNETKLVQTPFLIFPIRLIRSVATSPIAIEFMDEDIYINPCFIAKLRQVYGETIVKGFPSLTGISMDFDTPVNLELLKDGKEYFEAVKNYIDTCRSGGGEGTVFSFDKNSVAISQYNHDELCMYYDIKSHKEEIYNHPLVNRLFTESITGNIPTVPPFAGIPSFIKEYDSNQERMIKRVLAGESLVIKGPPGTGKTLTIVNMIATLLEQGKKVMMVSEKLAALSEVYNKLPDELRDFVMLLECETEAQAAKLNPTVIKRDLSALLRTANEWTSLPQSFYDDKNHQIYEMSKSQQELSNYYGENFLNTDLVGLSYYDALDVIEKYPDIETVPMVKDPRVFIGMSRDEYNRLLSTVKEAGIHFAGLTGEETHPMVLCPWYALDGNLKNTEEAIELAKVIKDKIADIRREADELFRPIETENIDGFGLTTVMNLLRSSITTDQVIEYKDKKDGIVEALRDYYLEAAALGAKAFLKVEISKEADLDSCAKELRALTVDPTLKITELKAIYEKWDLIGKLKGDSETLARTIIAAMDKYYDEEKLHTSNMCEIFAEGKINNDTLAQIDRGFKALSKYVGTDAQGPKLLDFGAKRAYEELSALSYLSNPKFMEIVNAAEEGSKAIECKLKTQEESEKLSRIFRQELSVEDLEAIFFIIRRSGIAGQRASEYASGIRTSYMSITNALEHAVCADNTTVEDLENAYIAADAISKLTEAWNDFGGLEIAIGERYDDAYMNRLMNAAESAVAVCEFIRQDALKFKPIEKIAEVLPDICKSGRVLGRKIDELLSDFKKFGEKCFKNCYSELQKQLTFAHLDIYAKESTDRGVLNAAVRYFAMRSDKSGDVTLEAFFKPFEYSMQNRGNREFTDIFEHSVFDLAVMAKRYQLSARNGRGNEIARHMDKFAQCEAAVREFNVKTIREACINRIKSCKSSEFAFLNAGRDNINTLRRIFKLYGAAILKLKKCMLVSPSTVSVLFGTPEYSDFDVLIVDESSQLEPTSILSVLFRAKQCVFVGDEWQMPPIKHFAKPSEHTIVSEDGSATFLPPETSVLALALNSGRFDVEQLACHYRSKTEALIAFSQERYYPYMRTFPASVPRSFGLGFKDIYIEDGRCDGGVNEAEAEAAIAELEKHFEVYYDHATGKLAESVGVVAFGESQLTKIKSLVNSNKSLKTMISTALTNFDDLPEKLIFFKTIETVQGQEIDHMIVSLTYGKDKNGKIREAYGDLGRSSVGECIFNVAVTRARSSVTMIHSVRPIDITNVFIRSYLEITERFDKDGRMQFISAGDTNRPGFIRSVADFIINELGISEERVVINCGATKGSVRMPIAILSPDASKAQLSIYCEMPSAPDKYIDNNIRYYNILKLRGWNTHRVFIHDWVDNKDNEKKAIAEAINKYVG